MSEGYKAPRTPGAREGKTAASQDDPWLVLEHEAIRARPEPPRRIYRDVPGRPRRDGGEHTEAPAGDATLPLSPGDPDAPSYAGLALSGGGIRSASFCLGVLQALNTARQLTDFGWLSTVSGGGYTGLGWLAHAFRTGKGFPYHLPEAPDSAMRTLRDRASYLKAPGLWPGMIAAGMLLRKLLANLALLAPLVLILAAAMGFLHTGSLALPGGATDWLLPLSWAVLLAMVLAALVALYKEGRKGAPARTHSDGVAARVLLGLMLAAAILLLTFLPDWSRSILGWARQYLPDFIQDDPAGKFVSLVTGITGLLGAGTLASRMKGRFATLGLTIIGVLFLLALLVLAVVIVHQVEWFFDCHAAEEAAAGMPPGSCDGHPLHLPLRFGAFAGLAFAGFAILVGVAWLVDANALSLHGYYRDRLQDAFFPAMPTPPAKPAPSLSDLLPIHTGGPLPVVNATVAGTNDAGMSRRGRPAGPFTLTPIQSGSEYLDYADTAKLEAAQMECDAATAMALSAAAVAPQAGRVTGGRVAVFFKALLNARTGRWMPAPRHVLSGKTVPRPDGWHALKEMFGSFTSLSRRPLILVSDGGHWENLGVLSLVHRHCPLILAIDAEADPEMGFNGLGIATMLSRLDAGTELRVDTSRLKPGANGRSPKHFRFGTLDYSDGRRGTLLYVKATLSGDEPPDVLTYAAANPTFPHETTADQFFSEAQFEAYRALGQHIGEEVAAALGSELRRLA